MYICTHDGIWKAFLEHGPIFVLSTFVWGETSACCSARQGSAGRVTVQCFAEKHLTSKVVKAPKVLVFRRLSFWSMPLLLHSVFSICTKESPMSPSLKKRTGFMLRMRKAALTSSRVPASGSPLNHPTIVIVGSPSMIQGKGHWKPVSVEYNRGPFLMIFGAVVVPGPVISHSCKEYGELEGSLSSELFVKDLLGKNEASYKEAARVLWFIVWILLTHQFVRSNSFPCQGFESSLHQLFWTLNGL